MTDAGSAPHVAAIRSAIARARTHGEPAAVYVLGPDDAASQEAEWVLRSGVRAADVVWDLGDGSVAVVLFRIGRLPACSVAERLERRIADVAGQAGASRVGMSLIAPWERRGEHRILASAREDLRQRLATAEQPVAVAA